MASSTRTLLLWSPRVLGILVALFVGMFALDVFGEGRGLLETLLALLIHLIPALVLLAVVFVAWRWEWVGGVVFLGLAALYAMHTLRRPDWILVISGPLLVVGLLYLASWAVSRAKPG